jgi:hypothetical protein
MTHFLKNFGYTYRADGRYGIICAIILYEKNNNDEKQKQILEFALPTISNISQGV